MLPIGNVTHTKCYQYKVHYMKMNLDKMILYETLLIPRLQTLK